MASSEMGRDTGDVATREYDQLGSAIFPINNQTARVLQVSRITRRCAISAAMAVVLAPLVFGEAQH